MSSREYFAIPMNFDVSSIRNVFKALDHSHEMTCLDGDLCTHMLEILGATFVADENHIFGAPNEDYIGREIEWYAKMSLNVYDIPGGPPKIWRDVAVQEDRGVGYLRKGTINSNYGFLLFHKENGRQYEHVLETLRKDPTSRQAVAVYTRPQIHEDATRGGMHDFICTNTVQYLIRDGLLHVVVNMRSNDAVYGFRNDYAWQLYVQEMICRDLKIEPGEIMWQVGSLHIYPRHRHLVHTYAQTGVHDGKL
uniref:Thymidylate synthase n=1 Tax=Micrococcus phage Kurnik TaxID=3092208 RepID=A0AAU6R7A5_9CAUD